MAKEEDEEVPVNFISEIDIFGQPIKEPDATPIIPEKPKFRFTDEPSFPIDRFLAGVIDILIVALVIHFINDVWLFPHQSFEDNNKASSISLLVGCLYHGFFDSSAWQGTPGKILLGIKIAGVGGRRISFLRSVTRYIASAISILVLLIGYINIFYSEKRRAWHDILCGTFVVRDKKTDEATYLRKRKNGYAVAVILTVIVSMIFINIYTMESERRNQEREDIFKKEQKEKNIKIGRDLLKTVKIAKEDFILTDSINGFRILVKGGFGYSTSYPVCNFIELDSSSGDLQIGYTLSKEELPDGLKYGNFLSKNFEGKEEFKVTNIKLLPFKNGYAIEQGNMVANKGGDTLYYIIRAYIKNKTIYLMSIWNNNKGKPIYENETIKKIFNSFQIMD